MSHKSILSKIYSDVHKEFEQNSRIMSFAQFVDAFASHPERYARNSVQYLRDCFLYYGESDQADLVDGERDFLLFQAPFDGGREPMVGQRRAQARVFSLIDNFVRSGRIDKLILLHGPNGSAKSTFNKSIMRAMEHFSTTDEGAMYRFNWIFPNEKTALHSSIGFGGAQMRSVNKAELETFAFLDNELIDTSLSDPLHDHPLLLLPVDLRREIIESALEQRPEDAVPFVLSDYIERGDLSHTNRQIFDALMTAYRGDLEKVLKHVQIERVYLSRRYRKGLVRVEPQMRVDAGLRQLTQDRSLGSLPPSLQNTTLFEPVGDLVDANRGVIEYDDLFKRSPELNKYLLSISERGSVALDDRILFVDLMLMASANEMYLDAFKQTPDYSSFKGRVEFVRLPYLLDYRCEALIYEEQLASVEVGKFIAPHTAEVAALWSVLTRLRRPNTDHYPSELRDIVGRLSPLEKADLYAVSRVPKDLAPEKARDLRAQVQEMRHEGASADFYEGRLGASPREMKMILMSASQNAKYSCLSPLSVFDELALLVKEHQVFPFLKMEPDGEYHRHERFIETVRTRYLDVLDQELQSAMGLIDERQYEELFARYIDHVSQSLKGEKVYNSITGTYEHPDEKFMAEFEESLGAESDDKNEFRHNLISSIGASFIDNPDEKIDYPRIFPSLFASLRQSVFEERVKAIQKIQEHLLMFFEGESDQLSSLELEAVQKTVHNLKSEFGHNDESAREAVAFLLASRYRER